MILDDADCALQNSFSGMIQYTRDQVTKLLSFLSLRVFCLFAVVVVGLFLLSLDGKCKQLLQP